jgi:hypothetical protein
MINLHVIGRLVKEAKAAELLFVNSPNVSCKKKAIRLGGWLLYA